MTPLLTSIFLIALGGIALYYAFVYYSAKLKAWVNLKLRAHGRKVKQLEKALADRDEIIEALKARMTAIEHMRVPGSVPPPQNLFQRSEDRHALANQEIVEVNGQEQPTKRAR